MLQEENKLLDNSNQINQKYRKILNNLLNISHNDSCIFSNVNNKKIFDINKKFGEVFFSKIIENEFFYLPLTETDYDDFLKKIQNVEKYSDIYEIYKKYNEEIPQEIQNQLSIKKSEENIEYIKQLIIKNTEIKKQKNTFKWKLILNEAKKMNELNNLWPIHIGMLYLTVKIENKVIQAPLFLKEVNIQIKNSKVFLISVGNIKLNEKLNYLLESNRFLFDLDFNYAKMSIKDFFEKIKKSWNQNFILPDDLIGNVPNFKNNEIENEKIEFWPGISLGFFEPTGGHLRKIMNHILENDLLEEILDIEFDKNIYKNTVDETIKKKNFGFYKIVYSNLSQDKAIVSALNQDTIIWGPPGTGKSQTITNILTNVLMFSKTALVVSQKKAALEVLKKRMKSLEIFCLFILNDRNLNKSTFYKPIKEYIEYLENLNEKADEKIIKIITNDEKYKMKLINSIMTQENALKNVLLYANYVKRNLYKREIFESIQNLDDSVKYNFSELKKQKKQKINKIGKFIMKNNNLSRPNIFTSVTKSIKESSKIIKEKLLNLNLDLDLFIHNKDKIDLDLLDKIHQLKQFKIKDKSLLINNDNNLKIIIAKNIFNKIKKLNDNMKKKYNAFALDVRTGSLDPIIFIKKHADIIKLIYPIIITNPETDLQSWTYQEFDYGLLDESSQIFLEKGIPVLYLTKIKIMAGDDQQMQPSRWFTTKIEDNENPFGNIESLLDFAIAKGTYAILLDKNYRSNFASLMTFNSQIFYKGKLDVVDVNVSKINKEQSIEVINVNGVWENSKNEKELEIIIEQAQQNINKYKKIILLCFNSSQQIALENLIFNSYPDLEEAIDNQQILIRNIENIQGDEADLLIVSVAYDRNTKFHSTYVAKSGGKNALNVATSRAKDKMIIVKSIYSDEIQNNNNSTDIEIFKEWLKFLDLSEEDKKNYIYRKNENKKENKTEIETNNSTKELIEIIKTDLLNEINDFDIKVDTIYQYSIGTIKIPLAFVDKKTNNFITGIYIDIFSYYRSYNDFINDKDIENFFIAKKYKIWRINPLDWEIKKIYIIKEINDYIFRNY